MFFHFYVWWYNGILGHQRVTWVSFFIIWPSCLSIRLTMYLLRFMNLVTVLQNCQRNDELQAITVKTMKSSWNKSWFKSVNTQYLIGRFYADLRFSVVSTGTSYPPCKLQWYWYNRLRNYGADNAQRSGAETTSWQPAEMYFTVVLWRRRCDTWPGLQTVKPFILYLLCSHKLMLMCADQADALILTRG